MCCFKCGYICVYVNFIFNLFLFCGAVYRQNITVSFTIKKRRQWFCGLNSNVFHIHVGKRMIDKKKNNLVSGNDVSDSDGSDVSCMHINTIHANLIHRSNRVFSHVCFIFITSHFTDVKHWNHYENKILQNAISNVCVLYSANASFLDV